MSLDRSKCPPSQSIDKLDIIKAVPSKLDNGIPFFTINAGTQEVTRIEFCFYGGIYQQKKPLVSNAVSHLLKEGTASKSGKELFEYLDYHGAFLETLSDNRTSRVVIYSLNKHLPKLLPLLKEILETSLFPENELKTYLTNLQQSHLVNMEKVSFIARQKFLNVLFGDNHPFGQVVTAETFEEISKNDVLDFFKEYYSTNNCFIVCSGIINEETYTIINQIFGNNFLAQSSPNLYPNHKVVPTKEKRHNVHKKDAVQACVRMGRHIIGKNHEDYFGLKVLNTIFGGYFGSRLMTKIREDKGYTYGISATLVSGKDAGYYLIQTEVKNDVAEDTVKEIYKEMKRLREELVPQDELNTVKSYMLGNFLRESDGPFALATQFANLYQNDFGYEHLNQLTKTIKDIDAHELKILANKYLNTNDFFEIIVGGVK